MLFGIACAGKVMMRVTTATGQSLYTTFKQVSISSEHSPHMSVSPSWRKWTCTVINDEFPTARHTLPSSYKNQEWRLSSSASSSSCSWRVRSVIRFLNPQDEVGPSTSSSVVPCSFVLLVYIVNARFGSLILSILCTCCSRHFFWYCFISFTILCAPV